MNRSRIFTILLPVGLLLLTWLPISAQDSNLLENPGFEAPFNTLDGSPPRIVAQGWTPWHIGPADPSAPSFAGVQPVYEPVVLLAGMTSELITDELGFDPPARVAEGENAQLIGSFFATHDGGVFQRVTGLEPDTNLRFAVMAYIWSSRLDDVNASEENGDVFVRVGIDPAGGSDPESADIVWSSPGVELYDAYNLYEIEATSTGNAVTVFVRTTVGLPVTNSHIYLDDAVLEVVGAADTATPEPTETPVPPSDTPEATDTPEPTTPAVDDAALTATALIAGATASAEAATQSAGVRVTETPAAATEEPEPTMPPVSDAELTATALIAGATASAEAATSEPSVTPIPASDTPEPTDEPEPTATEVPPTDEPTESGEALTATAIVEAMTLTAEADESATATPTAEPTAAPISDEFPSTITHTVRRGETVAVLAERYGSTIDAIAQANGLDSSYLIRVGQGLIIPVRLAAPATSTPTNTPVAPVASPTPAVSAPTQIPGSGTSTTVYYVQPGDTLLRIAQRFNTTVAALAQLNGIVNPDRIRVGQRILIPTAPQPPSSGGSVPAPSPQQQSYIVQPGDTLSRISLRFGVPISRLIQLNNIRNANRIFTGQRLIIP
jgi:LysM repeat protein